MKVRVQIRVSVRVGLGLGLGLGLGSAAAASSSIGKMTWHTLRHSALVLAVRRRARQAQQSRPSGCSERGGSERSTRRVSS